MRMAYNPYTQGIQMSEEVVVPSTEEPFLRVSAGSNPQSVASAIAHAIYESKAVKLRAVGAGAVNQAVKSIAIARGYVAPRGLDLTCKPGFTTIESRDGEISAIVFAISAS
jgi:stage V sporulation protein S